MYGIDGKPHAAVVANLEVGSDLFLSGALSKEPLELLHATGAAEALTVLEGFGAAVLIVVCLALDDGSLQLLREVQTRWPGMPVLLVTNAAASDSLTAAMELGASDVLVHPLAPEQVVFAVRKALAAVGRTALAPPPPRVEAGMVFGRSPAMVALHELVVQVAKSSSTALVRGESGTGKELVARALHRLSPRAERPFIKIDCTSLPETLIESELFGYERGAFTGAAAQKLGRVQLADGGTLFLDEVGELPLAVQAKLLRLLQDCEFERLGGKATLHVDVRVVAATHRDLETMVASGTFRQDLFYRLNVVPLWIPPLRARRRDVRDLAQHFCAETAANGANPGIRLTAGALEILAAQRWHGNVRQLKNFVERLVVLSKGPTIDEDAVQTELARPARFATETGTVGADAPRGIEATGQVLALDEALRVAERQALTRALGHAQGNRSAAARLLGVSRSALYNKLHEYGLL